MKINLNNFKFILSHYFFKNKKILISLALGMVAAATEIIITFFLSNLLIGSANLNIPILNIEVSKVNFLLILIFLLTLKVILSFLIQNLQNIIQRSLLLQFSSRIYEIILKDIPTFEFFRKGPGYYFSLAGDESFKLSSSISSFVNAINTSIILLAYIVFLAISSPQGIISFLLFIFLSLTFGFLLFKKIKENGIQHVMLSRSANTKFTDGTTNIKSIRCFEAEDFFVKNYKNELSQYTKSLIETDFLSAILKVVPTILILFFFTLVVIFSDDSSFEKITLVALIFFRLLPLTGNLYSIFLKLLNDLKSIDDLVMLLKRNRSLDLENHSTHIQCLEFKDFSYGYDDKKLISNMHFKFESGKFYAIHGESGLGKSTLFDILLGFKDDFTGDIIINGELQSSRDFSQNRKNIHLIEQSTAIFNDTVLNNILLGRQVSTEQLIKLIKLCVLDTTFPESSWSNIIDFKGNNLSGGQKQRLTLLRGLIGTPSMIILDETLVGLDNITKHQILHNLKEYFHDKIVIFITHDSEVMKFCDSSLDLNNFRNRN